MAGAPFLLGLALPGMAALLASALLHGLASRRLREAERLWARGAETERMLPLLPAHPGVAGELGYRIGLLRGRILMAAGRRDEAWEAYGEAHLRRLPFWARPGLRRILRAPDPSMERLERALRRFPDAARLHHRLAQALEARSDGETRDRAWDLRVAALPLAAEDPPLLEALMTSALEARLATERPPVALGKQELPPRLAYLFEESLAQLLRRHGDPRLGWDRSAPALHLLRAQRFPDLLLLTRDLPPSRRPQPLWEAEAVARRALGDLEGAWHTVQAGLDLHPTSFRLWMERHLLATAHGRIEAAGEALDMAQRVLLQAGEDPSRIAQEQEWRRYRAEHAFRCEGDPELAWELIHDLPQAPLLLRLRVRVALGHYEQALSELPPSPESADVALLQGECLAGLEAWEALAALLDPLPEVLRLRPDWWHLRGLAHSHLGTAIEAREALEQAARMDPRELRFVLDAGHACLDLDDPERAEAHWRQALRLDRHSEEALVQLAETRRLRHDAEGARRYLRECLLHHPDSEEAQARLAELEAN